MTKLNDLQFAVNRAVLDAIDTTVKAWLIEDGTMAPDQVQSGEVKDEDLPRLLPDIEAVTDTVLRRICEGLPEHLDVPEELRERTGRQLKESRRRVEALNG